MTVGIPDGVGELVGWRTWEVRDDGSLWSRCSWPSGTLQAQCLSWSVGIFHREPPDLYCTCGIYAVRTALDLIDQPGSERWERIKEGHAVAGQVALWGQVIEHERGWRAERARPVALALPPDPHPRVLLAQRRYGLPSVDDQGLYAAKRDEEIQGMPLLPLALRWIWTAGKRAGRGLTARRAQGQSPSGGPDDDGTTAAVMAAVNLDPDGDSAGGASQRAP